MLCATSSKENAPFRIPPGVRLVKIDARTGDLPGPGTDVIIDEAFRPGTEPGMNAFRDTSDCLSISGTCGNTGGVSTGFDPERDAGIVEETNPMRPQAEKPADDSLDGIF